MALNIADLFEHAVDAVPERTALVVHERRLTFAELDAQANRLADHLRREGIGRGDHVGIYGQNSVEWIVAMIAAFKIRAVPININFRYVAEELLYLFDNADLVALVHGAEYAPQITAPRSQLPLLRHLIWIDGATGRDENGDDGTDTGPDGALAALGSVPFAAALAAGSPERPPADRSPDDHYVIYTGGTTGMPKGVVWRHEDVLFALGGCIDAYTNERVSADTDLADKARASAGPIVSLNAPPLMHGAAQWGALRFFFEGNTVVFLPRFSAEGCGPPWKRSG